MMLSPEMATKCVQVAAILHNFLFKDSDPFVQEMEGKVENALKETRDLNVSGLRGVPRMRGYYSGIEARAVRNIFASYFSSREGHVPWQDHYACVEDLIDK